MIKELILMKIITPHMLIVFLAVTIVMEIHEIYTKRKNEELTTRCVISFLIRCFVAVVLSYCIYSIVLDA